MKDIRYNSLATWKADVLVRKGLNPQYNVEAFDDIGCSSFDVFAQDQGCRLIVRLLKSGDDYDDFVANVKPICNYASATVQAPFASDDYVFAGDICLPVAIASEATEANLDIKITANNLYTNGGKLIGTGIALGDWIEIQVVDKDDIYYPQETVLKSWGKILLDPAGGNDFLLPYAGHPYLNLYMRLVYHKAAGHAVTAGWSCYLHAQEI